jgi:hypothetical protein
MKNKNLLFLAITIFWYFSSNTGIAQNCVQCDLTSHPSGTNASTIGISDTASGYCSFAGGYNSNSAGQYSFAFGNDANALGNYSLAFGALSKAKYTGSITLGSYTISDGNKSIILGHGQYTHPLVNNVDHSIMMGINSDLPTFFIQSAIGIGRTGRIGIGNVTAPQAKLHIRADENYDTASVFIQSFNDNKPAYLWMGNKNFGIHKHSTTLEFLSAKDFVFNNNVGIGSDEPVAKLQVSDGDIFIEDIDRGIIMKSPDGNCWRGTVNNQGMLEFTQVDCQTLETGIENPETSHTDRVKIYPNPAGSQVFISFDETLGKLQLEISDINGRLISSQKLHNAESAIEFATFQPGTYLFRLTDESGKQVAVEKVIKE